MIEQVFIKGQDAGAIKTLGIREQYRDQYWQKRDPISVDRLLWRAQTFRHIVHLIFDASTHMGAWYDAVSPKPSARRSCLITDTVSCGEDESEFSSTLNL